MHAAYIVSMKTDVLLLILYFGSLIRQVNFQRKIVVFDPLSCSWHARFCIFVIILGNSATSNIFEISDRLQIGFAISVVKNCISMHSRGVLGVKTNMRVHCFYAG